jgi:hypothetical protein
MTAPAPPAHLSRIGLITSLGAVLFTLVQAALAMLGNDGHFIYTLDDAYIHLDLAEQFGRSGIYGVNAGIAASPASSILWPFLLAPLAGWEGLTYLPFVFNLAAIALAGFIMPELCQRCAGKPLSSPTLLTLSLLAMLLFNFPALAMMGMEHGPHVTCVLALALGLLRVLDGQKPPAWLWLAIFISPLLRYEGAIVSGCTLAYLFILGYRRQAFLTGLAIGVSLAAFTAFLLQLGLAPLPNSTIVKKAGHVGGLAAYLTYWRLLLEAPLHFHNTIAIALISAAPLTAATLFLYWKKLSGQNRLILGIILTCLVGQMVLGRYSLTEIYRYEYYLLAFIGPLALYAVRGFFNRRLLAVSGALLAVLVFWPALYSSMWDIRRASHVIYLQHYSVHKLVDEVWQAPIAANDIGLVGYRNPHFVLDLWGLGDSEVLQARRADEPGWLNRLLQKHDIRLILLNESWWSPELRATLVKLGELDRQIGSQLASDRVSFYTTDSRYLPEITEKLTPWVIALPQGASFRFTSSTAEPEK